MPFHHKKTSKELKLSFDFKILNYEERILDININGLLREIKENENLFDWFMEDLIFFLDSNRFQRRWDYKLIKLHNIISLDNKNNILSTKIINLLPSVTSWDMEVA
ncbi:MAG: hypothetical protein NC236_02305 [Mycoplasma sp.]|nr:hypothetical protein [Mycoplasma sp.]